jgi:hypothetical protein
MKLTDLPTAMQKIVNDWHGSKKYSEIQRNYAYYLGENPTLQKKWKRIALDTGGSLSLKPQQIVVSSLFQQIVDKREHRVLNNPIGLDEGVSLGDDFDFRAKDMLHDALISGVSWAFWNVDKIVQFKATEFIPIIDDNTHEMVKGIRVTQLAPDRPIIYEFFEVDGKTTFKQDKQGGKIEQMEEKTPYSYTYRQWGERKVITGTHNYGVLPIVPLYVNRERRSFMTEPVRSKINAYDMLYTFFTDEVLRSNFIYFMMSGYGGTIDEVVAIKETAQKLGILKQDGADAKIDAKTLNYPHEAMKSILDELWRGTFADSFTFDPTGIVGSANIATAVFAGQKPEEISSGGTGNFLVEWVKTLLKITGQESSVNIVQTPVIDDKSQTEMMMSVVDRGLPLEEALHYLPWAQGRLEDLQKAVAGKAIGMSDDDVAVFEEMVRHETIN